jgi:hypothetical protein
MTTPSVGGIRFFEFTQSTPSTVWTIYHAFGVYPIIDINVNTAGVIAKAFPMSIEHQDVNTSIVSWTTARSGTATLAATVA